MPLTCPTSTTSISSFGHIRNEKVRTSIIKPRRTPSSRDACAENYHSRLYLLASYSISISYFTLYLPCPVRHIAVPGYSLRLLTLVLDADWPLVLRTFSAVATHITNIYAEFHLNPYTEWTDIASRRMGFNVQRTGGQWTAGRRDS